MNCCKNDNDENKMKPLHNHKKHLLHMVLCCGLPLVIIFGLPLIGYKGFLTTVAPFICPIMMLIMVPMMLRDNSGGHSSSSPTDTKSIEEKQLS